MPPTSEEKKPQRGPDGSTTDDTSSSVPVHKRRHKPGGYSTDDTVCSIGESRSLGVIKKNLVHIINIMDRTQQAEPGCLNHCHTTPTGSNLPAVAAPNATDTDLTDHPTCPCCATDSDEPVKISSTHSEECRFHVCASTDSNQNAASTTNSEQAASTCQCHASSTTDGDQRCPTCSRATHTRRHYCRGQPRQSETQDSSDTSRLSASDRCVVSLTNSPGDASPQGRRESYLDRIKEIIQKLQNSKKKLKNDESQKQSWSEPVYQPLPEPEAESALEPQPERVDVYYFDHGNSGYYRTTDRVLPRLTEACGEAVEEHVTWFWAEIFGILHVVVMFFISFVLQLLRFVLFTLLRPITVGVIQLLSDYCFKPLLTIIFNGILQPVFILLYNIATSFRDLCEPIAQAIGFFLHQVAHVLRAIRLIEINKTNNYSQAST